MVKRKMMQLKKINTNRVWEKRDAEKKDGMAAETTERRRKISVSGRLVASCLASFTKQVQRISRSVTLLPPTRPHPAGKLMVTNKPIPYYTSTTMCFVFHLSTDLLQDWAQCSIFFFLFISSFYLMIIHIIAFFFFLFIFNGFKGEHTR